MAVKINGSRTLQKSSLGNVILVAMTLVVVFLGAMLPMFWMNNEMSWEEPVVAETVAERRKCWLDFYAKTSESGSYSTDLEAELARQMQDKTTQILRWAAIDQGQEVEEARGESCISVWSEGKRTRVWHYYRQWRGDWRNWIEMYIDVDTQEIYYLYISSGCERNKSLYQGLMDSRNPAEIGSDFLQVWGDMTVTEIQPTADGFVSRLSCAGVGGTVIYDVTWKYYPGSLMDFRVQLIGA